MNIGLGYDFSVNEYYKTVADVIGFKGGFYHDHNKPVGMKRKLLSISRQQEWGWNPQTTLIQGIQNTYAFFLENTKK